MRVASPWNDDSVAINIPNPPGDFAKSLNALYLPERFTAIWHSDVSDFEVIWTAFPLSPDLREIEGRSFEFRYRDKRYTCEFSASSDRLLTIAKGAVSVGQGITNYRNLMSYRRHALGTAEPAWKPLSFWIRGLEWSENEVLSLVDHLNFYLTYFDNMSPWVLVHSPKKEAVDKHVRVRYIRDSFPSNILARDLDDNLLNFWTGARSGDPARRFLQYYRILEYASVFYLDEATRAAVRRALAQPDALDDLKGVTEGVLSAVHRYKADDYARVEQMMKEVVSPQRLWRVVDSNRGTFASTTCFEGGLTVKPLPQTEEGFLNNGITLCANAFKGIRNALSHGRDQRAAGVILTTTSNFELLLPWVSLVSVAAGEAVLYREVL